MNCTRCKDKNFLIECKCGCHSVIQARDKRGRPRYWKHSHGGIPFKKGVPSLKKKTFEERKHRITSHGYAYILIPDYPRSNKIGYVAEHVLVYESYYVCCMLTWGIVHHKNEIRDDNRIENLLGMTKAMHNHIHVRRDKESGRFLKKKEDEPMGHNMLMYMQD